MRRAFRAAVLRGWRVVATAGLAISLLSCSGAADYVTAPVEIGDVRDVVPAVGTLRPVTSVEVRPTITGRVARLLVNPNDRVSAGQPLALVDSDSLQIELRSAQEAHASATAAKSAAAARLEQARISLATRRTLAAQGFVSEAALASSQSEVRILEAALVRHHAEVERASTEIAAALNALEEATIRAPMSGVVLALEVAPGDIVGPASERPIAVVASELSVLEVQVLVPETDIAAIHEDARVMFRVDAFPGQVFEGHTQSVALQPVESGAFVSYPVVVRVANPAGRLRPGMTAAVEFVNAEVRQVTRIPIEALYFEPEDYVPELSPDLMRELQESGATDPAALRAAEMGTLFARRLRRVFVFHDGGWERREVRIGGESSEHVEVVSGLAPGEVVVLDRMATDSATVSG